MRDLQGGRLLHTLDTSRRIPARERSPIIPASDLLPALAAIVGRHPAQPIPASATSAQVIPITGKERTA